MLLLPNKPAPCVDCSQNDCSQQSISSQELPRRDQRALIFHLLYALDAFDYQVSIETIVDNFSSGFGYLIPADGFVFQSTTRIIEARDELDNQLRPLLAHWRLERISTCTKLIMRLGLWELSTTETDPSIVINEAVELAKCFAETDAYRFVNGILDEWVKQSKNSISADKIK
jgi:transcription antitermination protein NusB